MLSREPTRVDQLGAELLRCIQIDPPWLFLRARVGNAREDIPNDIQACLVLVVCLNYGPRRVRMMRTSQHHVACTAVIVPMSLGGFIHRTQFPLFQGIAPPLAQPRSLLMLADIEVVLE